MTLGSLQISTISSTGKTGPLSIDREAALLMSAEAMVVLAKPSLKQ